MTICDTPIIIYYTPMIIYHTRVMIYHTPVIIYHTASDGFPSDASREKTLDEESIQRHTLLVVWQGGACVTVFVFTI